MTIPKNKTRIKNEEIEKIKHAVNGKIRQIKERDESLAKSRNQRNQLNSIQRMSVIKKLFAEFYAEATSLRPNWIAATNAFERLFSFGMCNITPRKHESILDGLESLCKRQIMKG